MPVINALPTPDDIILLDGLTEGPYLEAWKRVKAGLQGPRYLDVEPYFNDSNLLL